MYELCDKLRNLTPYDPLEGEYSLRLDANESSRTPPLWLREIRFNWLALAPSRARNALPALRVIPAPARRLKSLPARPRPSRLARRLRIASTDSDFHKPCRWARLIFYRQTEETIMRLDKYLKVSRIIKRRTIAKEACDGGRVTLNGRVAKAGSEVNENDVMEIRFGNRVGRYQITDVREVVRKENAAEMYRVLEEDETLRAQRGE